MYIYNIYIYIYTNEVYHTGLTARIAASEMFRFRWPVCDLDAFISLSYWSRRYLHTEIVVIFSESWELANLVVKVWRFHRGLASRGLFAWCWCFQKRSHHTGISLWHSPDPTLTRLKTAEFSQRAQPWLNSSPSWAFQNSEGAATSSAISYGRAMQWQVAMHLAQLQMEVGRNGGSWGKLLGTSTVCCPKSWNTNFT